MADERIWTKSLIRKFWRKITNYVDSKSSFDSPELTGIPTAPTAEAGTATSQVATTAFVMDAFQANDAMVFKGTIGSSGATITVLPNPHERGWTYKVVTDGTYAGKECKVGDSMVCMTDGSSADDSHWARVPIADEIAGLSAITEEEINEIFSSLL